MSGNKCIVGSRDPRQASPLAIEELLTLYRTAENIYIPRNIMFYAVCLVSVDIYLRLDELVKFRMEAVSFYQNSCNIKVVLAEICNNITYTTEYFLGPWEGRLSGSIQLDVSFNLKWWILIRGDEPGYLFCHIDANGRELHNRKMESKNFLNWFQAVLREGGESLVSSRSFRGHSLKRSMWKYGNLWDGWMTGSRVKCMPVAS